MFLPLILSNQLTEKATAYEKEVRVYFSVFDSVGIGSSILNFVFYIYIEDCFFTGSFPEYTIMTPNSYMVQLQRNCFYNIQHALSNMGTVFLGLSYGTVSYCTFLQISSISTSNFCFASLLPHEFYNSNLTNNRVNSFMAGDGVISYSIQNNNSNQEFEYSVTTEEKLDHIVISDSAQQYIFSQIQSSFFVIDCTFINNAASFAPDDIKKYNFTFINCYVDSKKPIPVLFQFINNKTSPMFLTNGMLNTYKCKAKIPMTIPQTYYLQVTFPSINPESVTPYIPPPKISNDVPSQGYTINKNNTQAGTANVINYPLLGSMIGLLIALVGVLAVLFVLRGRSHPVGSVDEVSEIGLSSAQTRVYVFPEDKTVHRSRSEDDFFNE